MREEPRERYEGLAMKRNSPCKILMKSEGAPMGGMREGRQRGILERDGGDEMNTREGEVAET